MKGTSIRYKNSILRFAKINSFGIWSSLIGLLILSLLIVINNKNNFHINGHKTILIILLGYLCFIWVPVLFLFVNYLSNTLKEKCIIDPANNLIHYHGNNTEQRLNFQEIKQVKEIKHICHKNDIELPLNYSDKFENSLGKHLRKTPWSGFSYTKIIGDNDEIIIITSLMTNYENIPLNNKEVEYVRFPWIKK